LKLRTEVERRINTADRALQSLHKGQISFRNIKIRIYKMVVRSIIQYWAEVCTHGIYICEHLWVSEKNNCRRKYGAVYSKGPWRIRYIYELDCMKMVDIVTLIRVKRLNCIGPINWIDDTGKVRKIFGNQPKGVRTGGSQDPDDGFVFGHILRREEIQIGGKPVGIGMNGRSLKKHRSTWHCRGN